MMRIEAIEERLSDVLSDLKQGFPLQKIMNVESKAKIILEGMVKTLNEEGGERLDPHFFEVMEKTTEVLRICNVLKNSFFEFKEVDL